jgi:hypothetical protein
MHNVYVLKFKKLRLGLILLIVLVLPASVLGKREHPEKWYQQKWCKAQKGQVEVVLQDGTRWDCVTDTRAIEFDFGDHWSEAVRQSAYYSIQTGKKAGIVLILETMKDRKYWIRLNTTIEHFNFPIDTWSVGNTSY